MQESKNRYHFKIVGLYTVVGIFIFSVCRFMDFSVFNFQTRHQNGDTHFLTLDEILDETKLLDISMKQKQWLMTEVCFCVLLYFFLITIFASGVNFYSCATLFIDLFNT